jgi:hypothetical protein
MGLDTMRSIAMMVLKTQRKKETTGTNAFAPNISVGCMIAVSEKAV